MGIFQQLYQSYEDLIDRTEKKIGNEPAAIIYILIAVVTNCAMVMFTKVHSSILPPVQGQVYRGILMTMIIYCYAKYKDIPLAVQDKAQDRMRILRNLIAAGFNILLAFIVTKIPMSTAMLIQTSSPFIIAFLDHLFYKTTYTRSEIIFSVMSMSGVLFIIKPDLFVEITDLNPEQYGYSQGAERLFWILIFVISVIAWSGSVIMLKYLRSLNAMTMNFPFGICLAWSSSLIQVNYEQVKEISFILALQIPIIFGLVTFLNQHTYVKANQLGKPAKLALLTNLNVVLSFLFEIFYLNESAHWVSLVGAFLIVGSSLMLSISRLEQAKKV